MTVIEVGAAAPTIFSGGRFSRNARDSRASARIMMRHGTILPRCQWHGGHGHNFVAFDTGRDAALSIRGRAEGERCPSSR